MSLGKSPERKCHAFRAYHVRSLACSLVHALSCPPQCCADVLYISYANNHACFKLVRFNSIAGIFVYINYPPVRPNSHRTVLFGVRVTVALLSQVIWWNGIWGVLDSHLAGTTNSSWALEHLDNYWERNVIYIFVAAVLLRLCNGLYSNCGVIPYTWISGVEMDAVTG